MERFLPLLALFILHLFSATEGTNSTDEQANFTCLNEHIHDNLNIRNVTGRWYIQEIYTHLLIPGVKRLPHCPGVTIWEEDEFPRSTYGPSTENQLFHVQHINARFRQQYRHLRLLWTEEHDTVEYSLYFKNDSVGYWQVLDGQNGTLTGRPSYTQFSGTIQVLKAVHDHLVLNFCQEASQGRPAQLYSVLLSREVGTLPRWEIESIHTMLQNKKLSVASRRLVCGNSADRQLHSLVLSFLTCVVAYVVGSS